MPSANRAQGNLGEKIAAAFLMKKGYQILDRQWRCAQGEIDLVARDGKTTVVVEVKTRRDQRFGPPELAINPDKARRLARLAEYYIRAAGSREPARIDVVTVALRSDGAADVRHYENALADLPFLDSRRAAW